MRSAASMRVGCCTAQARRTGEGVHIAGSFVWHQGLTFRVAPGSNDACTAKTARVHAVVQHAELPGSGACLVHEPMTGLGSLDERKKSQDPRAFLPTPERPRGLPHCRLHCPAEDLVEDTGGCETLIPIQKHGSAPDEDHPAVYQRRWRLTCWEQWIVGSRYDH